MINYSNLLKIGIHDPSQIIYRVGGKYLPDLLFKRYEKLAQRQGLDQLYVILSFDCDSPEDIPAAKIIHSNLKKRGLKGTFAVPGHLLEEGGEVYRRLSDDGADFINHGALPHVEKRDGRYWSTTFYNDMPVGEVIQDIKKGHEIFNSVMGHPPIGFRAPHFGTIQNQSTINSIYDTLRELKYLYSSSTMPISGFRFGPVQKINELYEIPLSGSYFGPLEVFDSWNNVINPYTPILKKEYSIQFEKTIEHLIRLNICGVLNFYVDPAHVVKNNTFFQVLDFIAKREISTLYYPELIEIVENKN